MATKFQLRRLQGIAPAQLFGRGDDRPHGVAAPMLLTPRGVGQSSKAPQSENKSML